MDAVKERFDSLEPNAQDTVLNIGMMMYEHGRRGLTDAAVDAEREVAEQRERELREEIRVMRVRAEERERELRDRFREEVADRADQLASEREGALQRELERVRESSSRENRRVTEEHAAALERLREVTDRLMGVAENSSKRGKAGEVIAAEEVRRVFRDATDIEDKASEGRSGDIHVTLPGIGRVILDIKHHAKGAGGVRKKDREKLLRDIDDEKNGAVAGILVATQASIQGMEPGSVLYSLKYRRPMVACELRGDWDRLRDARSVLHMILVQSSDTDERCVTSTNVGNDTERPVLLEDIASVLRDTLQSLRIHRESLRQKMMDVTQMMGDVCVRIERIQSHLGYVPTYNTEEDIEHWLLTKVCVNDKAVDATSRVGIKEITGMEGAPPRILTKHGKTDIRDVLIRMGARFSKGGVRTLNVVPRVSEV